MTQSQSIACVLAVTWLQRNEHPIEAWSQGRYAGARLAAKALIRSGLDGKIIGHWFRIYRKQLA